MPQGAIQTILGYSPEYIPVLFSERLIWAAKPSLILVSLDLSLVRGGGGHWYHKKVQILVVIFDKVYV